MMASESVTTVVLLKHAHQNFVNDGVHASNLEKNEADVAADAAQKKENVEKYVNPIESGSTKEKV